MSEPTTDELLVRLTYPSTTASAIRAAAKTIAAAEAAATLRITKAIMKIVMTMDYARPEDAANLWGESEALEILCPKDEEEWLGRLTRHALREEVRWKLEAMKEEVGDLDIFREMIDAVFANGQSVGEQR